MSTIQDRIGALFIGLGSIGARHLTNLAALCQGRGLRLNVSALRATERELPPQAASLVDQVFTQLPEGGRYDVAFITNPTNMHADTIKSLEGRVGAFFIEKPIFERAHADLAALGLTPAQKAYVAAPMRWTGLYTAVREYLKNSGERVFSARAICSSYLPDWRKDVDYRDNYSAHRKQGGGVLLDLIHEWDYLADLFGLPDKCLALSGKFSNLDVDSDDLAIYIAQYREMLCEVHLDYFGRTYRRTLELFCQEGTLVADFGNGMLTLPSGETRCYEEPPNQRYEREMAYFLDYALTGAGESVNSPRHAQDVLKLALGE